MKLPAMIRYVLLAAGVVVAALVVLTMSIVGVLVLAVVLALSFAVSALGRSSRPPQSPSTLEAVREADGSYRIEVGPNREKSDPNGE